MARDQTIFSELALASAINGNSLIGIANVDENALSAYKREFDNRNKSNVGKKKIDTLFAAGKLIRNKLLQDGVSKLVLEWTGNEKNSGMSTVAKDINVANLNTRISVKENADVFINGSPETIFSDLPRGIFGQRIKGDDWFQRTALDELNEYFDACTGKQITGYDDVVSFYNNADRSLKKKFSKIVREMHVNGSSAIIGSYEKLCNKVSLESANIFNNNLSNFIKTSKNSSKAYEPIFHFFFKLNSVKYILAGAEKGKPFAVYMMTSDEWIKTYDFVGINATPLKKGQPEVMLQFDFRDKRNKENFSFFARVEIRWSHGKFCGNPEGKVYKTWKYTELPWSEIILP